MAIDKYLDNITSQHRDKPKFIAWLSSSLNIIDHAYIMTKNMDNDFDLDNAIGKQLDILGQIIGRKRTLTFQPLNGHNPVLDDETYKLVLKAKVAMNMWDGKIESAYEIWNNIFNDIGLQLQDNQDMSLTAYITGYVNQIRQDLIQHGYIVPKPEGVRINYIGRTPIDFKVHSAMVVYSQQISTIQMSFDPTEKIDMKLHSRITVQGIQKTTIKCEGGKEIHGNI
ncbi:DUF2612 domain-containing protein [Clostridium neonatale]|uniref:DUF2612 domain-containing protein n=2 Tax=Clostridium neonatale TaxID=137838 RepID=UPI00291C07E2|nr:DUF2612 domain-containing protein [Clostridium neonatale]CAI3643047.1 Protein of uncharacterized function (DUF2612) [Clostridium neonatale]CAI3646408.1 Protein of uncharacterized function (DUF2612) [Clostridium neonatale]CAI3657888.1 Protein of uncharacterized function (DUF2612) [Clostridium neonatale]CAI3701648.1 Protein of uncharacterized function (DUF2612) [Clostridium neonatale]CAI3702621.1 Protein of uncharacterized function (DUF2612) [Clostridium neonatale]